jgi:hypothetical protein
MKTNIYSNLELVISSSSNENIGNSANYKQISNWNGSLSGNVTSVGSNGDPSYYGIYDMAGQVYEWTDSYVNTTGTKIIRGGSFIDYNPQILSKSYYHSFPVNYMIKDGCFGIRIASLNNNNNYSGLILISNTGNFNDTCISGIGSVNYEYHMSENLITNTEYCNFLNTIDISGFNNDDLYDSKMQFSPVGGIYIYSCAKTGNKYKIKDKEASFHFSLNTKHRIRYIIVFKMFTFY